MIIIRPSHKYAFVLVLLVLISCQKKTTQKASAKVKGSTQEMVLELKSIAEDTSNINVWHLNRLRAKAIDQKLDQVQDPGQYISLLFKSGIEWLNAGEYELAIDKLNSIFSLIKRQNLKLPKEATYKIKEVLGIAYLRKAEIENCVQNHNAYSCLIPIEKEGQHINREGAEQARSIFKELLNTPNPTLQTKWLYNIAHMTLGGYPSEIENTHLIDESIFKSEVPFPRFKDVGMSLGVAVNDISGSVVMDDFNNDGYLDLMVSSYGLDDQLRYFQNNQQGGFDDLTEASGLLGLWSGLNMVQADYNNDGWVDVLVLRGAWLGEDGDHPNSLLKNNGDGTFSDVTKESGLYDHYPTQTASWADFNNDGWVDLFIGNEDSRQISAPSQLFKNNQDGTFTNVALEKGLNVEGFIKGCVWGDYNNDGNPDLYVSLVDQHNYLFQNGGPDNDYKFTDVTAKSNTAEPQLSFPCWFFDYNQDGWEDIFVSGFDFRQFQTAAGEVAKDYLNQPHKAELPKLYRNNRDGSFTDVSQDVNVDKVLFTMGCNFGDLNNDGFPDFYAGTGTPDFRALIPNRMFLNGAGQQFYDVTTAGGFGHLQKGHGVAFGDLDHDGDQDIYTVLGGSYDGDNFMNALFLNPGNPNHWIKLKLKGTVSNTSAIGARVKIVASNAKKETKTFYNTVNSGGSFGANPLLVEQGLDNFDTIDRVEVIWPGQTNPQTFKNVDVNAFYVITEGIKEPTPMNKKPVNFQSHHRHD